MEDAKYPLEIKLSPTADESDFLAAGFTKKEFNEYELTVPLYKNHNEAVIKVVFTASIGTELRPGWIGFRVLQSVDETSYAPYYSHSLNPGQTNLVLDIVEKNLSRTITRLKQSHIIKGENERDEYRRTGRKFMSNLSKRRGYDRD